MVLPPGLGLRNIDHSVGEDLAKGFGIRLVRELHQVPKTQMVGFVHGARSLGIHDMQGHCVACVGPQVAQADHV